MVTNSRDDIDVSCVRLNDSWDDQESGLSGQEQEQDECGAPDKRREVSTFRSGLALVWKFMSDLLPENTNVSRSKQVPRSLLSAPHDAKEQNQWLPFAPMIRHWFDKWITEGKQTSSSFFRRQQTKNMVINPEHWVHSQLPINRDQIIIINVCQMISLSRDLRYQVTSKRKSKGKRYLILPLDFDFIECFTTTFLRTHSWLNWVEIFPLEYPWPEH